MNLAPRILAVQCDDGHRYEVIACVPAHPIARLLWLPALGVAARHYLPLAQALAAKGVAVYLHEWRGNGSSSLRPSRALDWGYREVLEQDLPGSRPFWLQRMKRLAPCPDHRRPQPWRAAGLRACRTPSAALQPAVAGRQRLTVLAWLPATTRMAAAAGLPLSAVDRAAPACCMAVALASAAPRRAA